MGGLRQSLPAFVMTKDDKLTRKPFRLELDKMAAPDFRAVLSAIQLPCKV